MAITAAARSGQNYSEVDPDRAGAVTQSCDKGQRPSDKKGGIWGDDVSRRHHRFWFTVGSTYTYPTVARLHEVEAASGARLRWRPFNARAIMQEMNNVPFATKPIKLAYMWRDVERRASKYDLPIKVPTAYPLRNFDWPAA